MKVFGFQNETPIKVAVRISFLEYDNYMTGFEYFLLIVIAFIFFLVAHMIPTYL